MGAYNISIIYYFIIFQDKNSYVCDKFTIMINIGIFGNSKRAKLMIDAIKTIPETGIIYLPEDNKQDIKDIDNRHLAKDENDLIQRSDAMIYEIEKNCHSSIAAALKNSKSVLISFPHLYEPDEIKSFRKIADESNVNILLNTDLVLSYTNINAEWLTINPRLIEVEYFNKDIAYRDNKSALFHLLYHHLCIINQMVDCSVRKFSAQYFPLDNHRLMIIYCMLELDNGAIVSLTSGNLKDEEKNEIKMYQESNIIIYDLLNNKSIIREYSGDRNFKPIFRSRNHHFLSHMLFVEDIVNKKNKALLDPADKNYESFLLFHRILNHLDVME